MPSTRRLFVALLPAPPLREALGCIAAGVRDVRWVAPEQYHLTLRFIGEAEAAVVRAAAEALDKVSVAPFFLEPGGVGVFPPRGQPAVLWAGLGRGHPLLHQLRQQVDDRLLAAPLPLELRAFVPHITLGRCGEAPPVAVQHWLKAHRDFAGPFWPVESFDLMESELTPAGAVHRVVRSYPLRGKRTDVQ